MASVSKLPSGRWRARWREYPGGPQLARHFASKGAANDHIVRVQHELARGIYVTPDAAATTFEEYVELFRSRRVNRAATRRVSDQALAYALAEWRERPMSTIRLPDVQALVARFDLAPGSIKTYMGQISAVFAMAVSENYIAKNPCVGVKLPKPDAGRVDPLTVDEVRRLHDAAPDWLRIAIVVGAGLGIRQSEMRGLTLDRVRFLRREIRIDRQLANTELAWCPPKTANSVRTIPADSALLEAISAHVKRHGEGPDGLVLHRDGRHVGGSAFNSKWRSLRAGAGLPNARYHDLRHHLASELLADGLSLVAVAAVLGDKPATVLSTYGHLVRSDSERVRATMRRLCAPEPGLETAEDSLRTAE